MKQFWTIYTLLALGFAIATTMLGVSPATTVISWVADANGEYLAAVPIVLLFFLLMILGSLIFGVYCMVMSRRPDTTIENPDQSGIIIRRDQSDHRKIFPMQVLVNRKQKATLIVGKTRQIALPAGIYTLQVSAMGTISQPVQVELSGNEAAIYRTGYKPWGGAEQLYIEEVAGQSETPPPDNGGNREEFLA